MRPIVASPGRISVRNRRMRFSGRSMTTTFPRSAGSAVNLPSEQWSRCCVNPQGGCGPRRLSRSTAVPIPAIADYRRGPVVDLALRSLSFARRAEEARAEAATRGLREGVPARFRLGRRDDYAWGYTVGSLGAVLRLERNANGSSIACDELGTNSIDVDRSAPSKAFADIDVDRVLNQCTDASPRSKYARARALDRQADVVSRPPPEESLHLLFEAARARFDHCLQQHRRRGHQFGDGRRQGRALRHRRRPVDDILRVDAAACLSRCRAGAPRRVENGGRLPHHDLARKQGRRPRLASKRTATLPIPGPPIRQSKAFHFELAARLFSGEGDPTKSAEAQAALKALAVSQDALTRALAAADRWKPITPKLLDDALEARILALVYPSRGGAIAESTCRRRGDRHNGILAPGGKSMTSQHGLRRKSAVAKRRPLVKFGEIALASR